GRRQAPAGRTSGCPRPDGARNAGRITGDGAARRHGPSLCGRAGPARWQHDRIRPPRRLSGCRRPTGRPWRAAAGSVAAGFDLADDAAELVEAVDVAARLDLEVVGPGDAVRAVFPGTVPLFAEELAVAAVATFEAVAGLGALLDPTGTGHRQ